MFIEPFIELKKIGKKKSYHLILGGNFFFCSISFLFYGGITSVMQESEISKIFQI